MWMHVSKQATSSNIRILKTAPTLTPFPCLQDDEQLASWLLACSHASTHTVQESMHPNLCSGSMPHHCVQDEEEVARLADRMRHLLAPFVLRRLKSEVAGQLTAKQHRTEQVSMTEAQGDLYKQAFSDIRKEATAAGGCSWRARKPPLQVDTLCPSRHP